MSASPASPYAREGKDFAFSIDSDIEENTVLENDNGVEMVPVGNGGGGQRRQESSAERVTDGPSNERLLVSLTEYIVPCGYCKGVFSRSKMFWAIGCVLVCACVHIV